MNRNQQTNAMMDELKLKDAFTEEERKLIEKGGYSISDNEEDINSASLKHSLMSDGIENSKINLKPQKTIQKMLHPLENQRKENELLNKLESLKQEKNFEIQQLKQELSLQKSKQLQTDSLIPRIKESVNQVRDMLNGLVPENAYLRLRDISEKDLQVNEFVLVRIWELIYPFKKENDLQRKELTRLREELRQSGEKQQQLLNEIEHNTRLMNDKTDDSKRFELNYENMRKGLQLELKKAQEEMVIMKEKVASYDELYRKFKQVEQEKQLMEDKLGFYSNQKEGSNLMSEMYKQSDDMRRKNELLIQDKEYMTRENISLLEKNKRLEDRLDNLEREIVQAKDQAQEYLFQLLNQKNSTAVEFERRINKEVSELREKHNFELENTKNNLIEIYEKQLNFLKEHKEEKDLKIENLEAQLREKNVGYQQLMIENRTIQKKVENDLAEVRVQLRLKSDDLERITTIYEETLANLKANKLENEMLRDKLTVLKSEFYKQELTQKEEFTQMKADLAVTKEQLRNYEAIEKEIDEAVMSIGNENSFKDNIYVQTIENAPTSAKRRIRQALQLAQKLSQKQRENENITGELREAKSNLETMGQELRLARDLIDKTNQPYSYLMSAVEEKEKEIIKQKQFIKSLDQNYQNLRVEYEGLRKLFEKSEGDIKKLLIRRENIANIQGLLVKLASAEKENIQHTAQQIIEEISSILNNKNAIQTRQQIINQREFNDLIPQVPDWAGKFGKK